MQRNRRLTATSTIRTGRERLRALTQDPRQHVRWDLRFTDIGELPAPRGWQRFRYATRVGPGCTIEGWGETRLDRGGAALRFGSDDRRSLIERGAGSWTYTDVAGGQRFATTYDYAVRFGWAGRVVDRWVLRPLMVWATRWSFDRLRLWIEDDLRPELAWRLWVVSFLARFALGVTWIWVGLVPKLLVASAAEVELTRRSGAWIVSPRWTLGLLGAVQIVHGLWLLSGRAPRAAATCAVATVLVLSAWVALLDPAALVDPLGGIVKNMALLACAAALILLRPLTPSAARAR